MLLLLSLFFLSITPWNVFWLYNIHLELHLCKFFLAVWKLIVTTYLSFCTLQFGSFKHSQSYFKAKASSFVSLNSSSVSHWLVLWTVASAPQEAREIRHISKGCKGTNFREQKNDLITLFMLSPKTKETDQKKLHKHKQQILLLSVTSMSIRYSLAVLILHTEASFQNLPGCFSQIPNQSDTGWFQILRRGLFHKRLWGGRKSVCVEKKHFRGENRTLYKGTCLPHYWCNELFQFIQQLIY